MLEFMGRNLLKHPSLGVSLALGFGAVIAVLGALGVASYEMFQQISNNVHALGTQDIPTLKGSTAVERNAFTALVAERSYLFQREEALYKTLAQGVGPNGWKGPIAVEAVEWKTKRP
ncbi:hypothetical protein CCP3SC15_250004 [Gammaproteobacteria bacterium]